MTDTQQSTIETLKTKTLEDASAHLVTTVDDVMKSVSEAFPEVAGKGFEAYTKYVYAEGVGDIYIGSICLIVFILGIFVLKKINSLITESFDYIPLNVCGVGALFVLFCVSNSYIKGGVTKLIAPEGYVVHEIVRNLTNAQPKTRQ